MSRRRPKPARARKPSAPASLRLPHGDPLPERPRRGERPDISVTRLRGTYTSVGYRSAKIAEREGRSPSRAGAVTHERVDRLKLQFQSREFARNNGIYKGMLARARAYIVGRGFKLQVKSGSRRWNRLVEKAWKKWWKRPEVTGRFSGSRLEGLVMDEVLITGEAAVACTDRDLLQVFEAEQLMGRNWLAQGIDLDETGAAIRYWVSPYDPNSGAILHGKAQPYSPETFLYVSAPERPSSKRSGPPCQASFPMLHRISDVCDSEAIAWQMQARVALISNREGGPIAPAAARKNTSRPDVDGDPTENYLTELDVALIFHGKPGETVSGMERTAPGGQFSETLTMFFRLLGLPLGLPLELILLDWTNSNYSQSRAVLEQAFTTFLGWQDLLEDLFHRPVFEWWLARAIERGEIPARADVEHDWIRPTFPWIDQLAEAKAQGEKVDRGFGTYSDVCKSLNAEREDVLEVLRVETLDAIELAQDIEEETGVAVPWQPFAGKQAPKASAAPATSNTEDAEDAGAGDEGAPAKKDKKTPPAGKKSARTRVARPARRALARHPRRTRLGAVLT